MPKRYTLSIHLWNFGDGASTRRATPSWDPLWSVVLIGAALSIFASYLFNIQSMLVQALMITLLTSMIALLMFFIAATDHPFRGTNAIGPQAYQIVLRNLREYE